MNRILWLVVSVFTILFYYLLLSCHNFDDNHPHHFIISHMPSNINEGKLMNSLVPSKETEGFDAGKCILIDNLRSNYQQQDVVVKCFPLFIIAGSMKCGTGEMMKWLQLHPLLRVGKGKTKINERETHYFTRHISQQTIYNNSNVYKADLLRNYLEHFPFFTLKESKTLYNFEKSPDYIRSITALKIIKSVLPNISLIILLRDPVKRALSEFFHHCRHKRYIKFIQEYNTSTVYYNRNAIVNGATGLLQGIPTYYYSTLLSCDMQHAEIYFTASILLKRKHYVEELLNGLYYNQLLGLLKM